MANTDKKFQTNAQDPQQPAQPAPLGADGKPVQEVHPGDEPKAIENKSSTGQGTTQEDADAAAAGNYRVLENISFGGKDGNAHGKPGDIVFLSAEDAKWLLKAKAVESADTSGLEKKSASDPRKIQ